MSQWLEVNHLEVTNLTTEQLESFFGARRTAGYALISPRSLRPVIKVFAACGAPFAVGSPAPIDAGDTSVIARYKRYLVEVRGLQLPTVVAYAARVSRFLASCGVDRELASLTASDVTRAILAESRGSLSEPRSIS
ncbi:MAG: site-specific integrase [Chloroflexi bacterium]|nr:site-specific integrase [Chloroflexota bacterium]